MTPDTISLGLRFFAKAFAEAENSNEAQKIKDCAYELNIPIHDNSLFESIANITKP
jgi:hypothetical protein